MLNFKPKPPAKCKHCGKVRGQHQAMTLACPFGRGRFPSFRKEQVFEPKIKQSKAEE